MAKTTAPTTRQPAPPSSTHTLASRLHELISACFTGIWVQTQEPHEAAREITDLRRQEGWRLGIWNCDSGMQFPIEQIAMPGVTDAQDPLAAVRAMPQVANGSGTTIMLFENLHRFLGSVELIQAVSLQALSGRNNRAFVVVLAPVTQIPPELDKLFVCLDHVLPDHAQLEEIARGVATQDGELPSGDELGRVIDAAKGLTRGEAENAYSLSLVRHGTLKAETLWEIKAGQLKKSGLVSIHRGTESFQQLGGLDNLKAFCLRAMRRQSEGTVSNRPRGVLLLSPPGCGKSQFAKALGNETGRPTVVLDVGNLLGSLVGQSESNVRAALRLADAMAPCVLFCDEIEKALAGATSSGQTDSGVTARVFGSLLKWLNDHESDVFFVGTCNDASKLPPEFARAERFDGVFFVDLPVRDQKDAIWGIYTRHYGRTRSRPGPMTPTGPGPRSSHAAGWRVFWTCRSFKPRRTSYPWLSLRATRSRGYASGLPVGACRRIGRGCIRGRKGVVVAGECGGWCGPIEAGRENTGGGRPVMATCSPCVGITLDGANQARLRRRNIE